MFKHTPETTTDVVLIGGGIMSATLGTLLKELDHSLTIEVYERLEDVATESSDAWNNAGTGHSALCELNYTPQLADGSVDISKAIKIAVSFEKSKQFWAYLAEKNYIQDPSQFIHAVPHMSFVWGEENTAYLRKRFEAMKAHPLFKEMRFSEDHNELEKWFPLIMQGRDKNEHVAANRMDIGTDVNFGTLTRLLFKHLHEDENNVNVHLQHEVHHLHKDEEGYWHVEVEDLAAKEKRKVKAKFVFIGAGGAALTLLEKSHIPEAKGYGGFPVSGQWLVCHKQEIVEKHFAKVYGKAEVGSPPMSVPHLDTRIINGKKALLFGPYAGFSTKFLKHGSLLDLPKSIRVGNIIPLLSAGLHNIPLTEYLIHQVRQSDEERFEALKKFVPEANMEDWDLQEAGQRVQIIKKDKKEGGVLEFGTEVVSSVDGSIAALLGASPGASTAVSIMLDLLKQCFPQKMRSAEWKEKLNAMIPTLEKDFANDGQLIKETRKRTSAALQLEMVEAG